MLHRVQELTGLEPGRFWGGTFHGIGHRALRMHGEAIGLPKNFTILDADESETLLKQTVEAEDKMFFKDKTNPRPGPLFSVLSLARNTQLSLAETVSDQFPQYAEISHRFPAFAAAYAKKKREQNVVDYDDLLELWLKLLTDAPEVAQHFANRFRHVLVDEYQDTNTLQAQIVDKLAAHHRVMAVGDDAQCIYSWRGADFENIMTFPERHPGTVIHRIETNYRSTPQILALANGVLEAQPKGRHFEKELRAHRANSQKPFVVQAMDDREQADFILKRIRSLVDDDGVSLNEIAILYRSHFLALEIQLALSRAGMPYQITSGVKFFERQHIRDLIALLRFVYNPADEQAWQRIAILLPKIGEKGAQKIYAVARENAQLLRKNFIDVLPTDDVLSKVAKDARDDWPNFCTSLQQIAEAMQNRKPAETVEIAIDSWYGDYLKGAYADYVDRLEELKALIGFAQRFDETQDFLAQIVLLNGETSERRARTSRRPRRGPGAGTSISSVRPEPRCWMSWRKGRRQGATVWARPAEDCSVKAAKAATINASTVSRGVNQQRRSKLACSAKSSNKPASGIASGWPGRKAARTLRPSQYRKTPSGSRPSRPTSAKSCSQSWWA
jgi:DNA helicase-2/ATP-dependent DNA helicase PcrA